MKVERGAFTLKRLLKILAIITLLIVTWRLCFFNISHKSPEVNDLPDNRTTLSCNDYGAILSESFDQIDGAIVETVTLYSKENELSKKKFTRNGILVRYPNAVGTVLMCHGFMCNKHDLAVLRRLFPRGQYNIMSFDFRAHGDNKEGQICTLGKEEAHEVIAAAHFIKNHPIVKDISLFVYGFSMGAVAAIEAQAKDPSLFQAMILDCPFESSENVLKRGLDHLKVTLFGYTFDMPGKYLLERYAFHPYVQSFVRVVLKAVANMDSRDIPLCVSPFSPGTSIAKVRVPLLFIHCKNDRKVSVKAIKEVFNNASSDYKTLWLTNGRGHFDSYFYSPEKYTEWVRNFLDEATKGALGTQAKKEIIEDKEEQVVL